LWLSRFFPHKTVRTIVIQQLWIVKEKATQIIDAIATQAQALWGDRHLAELVKRYCEIESNELGREVQPVQRRSPLVHALKKKTVNSPPSRGYSQQSAWK